MCNRLLYTGKCGAMEAADAVCSMTRQNCLINIYIKQLVICSLNSSLSASCHAVEERCLQEQD